MFQWLPICSLLNKHTLVVHGGIWKDLTIDEFRKLNRPYNPPVSGPICDALWSDPGDTNGYNDSPRGTSFKFGKDCTKEFCNRSNIKRIIRSHEMKMDGYEEIHDKLCTTVFSAPNYCDQMKNKGAYILMTWKNNTFEEVIKKFEEVPHPNKKSMQ